MVYVRLVGVCATLLVVASRRYAAEGQAALLHSHWGIKVFISENSCLNYAYERVNITRTHWQQFRPAFPIFRTGTGLA
jgi:hypothetical protein